MNMNRAGRSRREVFLEHAMLLFVLFVAAGMAGLFGLMVDVPLLAHGISIFTVLFVSHALCGLLLSSLYWHKRVWTQEEKEILDDRLNKVALMNHYVRNALSVLAFYGRDSQREEAPEAVDSAVRRIEWALSDVLPCGWDIDHLVAKPIRAKLTELSRHKPAEEAATDLRRAG